MTSDGLEYSYPVDITQLPANGRDYKISADAAERAQVSAWLGLSDLTRLDAVITIAPATGGLITVKGALNADVVQQCVVSLAPVTATISEDFDLAFSRGKKPHKDEEELEISTDDDEPDVLTGDQIDLAELLVEQLALFIDPYPRVPGAVFKNPLKGGDEPEKATVSPFAALAKLKTNNKNN